jgi:hypothetical protein
MKLTALPGTFGPADRIVPLFAFYPLAGLIDHEDRWVWPSLGWSRSPRVGRWGSPGLSISDWLTRVRRGSTQLRSWMSTALSDANVFRHRAAQNSLNFVSVFGCQTSAACLTADTFTKLREFISFFGSLWCQRIQPLDRSAHKGKSKGYLWGDRRRSV